MIFDQTSPDVLILTRPALGVTLGDDPRAARRSRR
jgi:hypothetical protein